MSGSGSRPERVGAVVNPAAGDGRGEELFAALAAVFPDATVESTVTGGPGDVPRAARAHADADLLAVVGGDGTLREVAGALYEDAVGAEHTSGEGGAGPPLFAVPAGRGNSTYRHVWGDADWRAVVRGLAGGLAARPLDLGRATGDSFGERYFLLGFSAGLFGHALDAAESLRLLPGPLAYVLGTARATLATDPVTVTVTRGSAEGDDGGTDAEGDRAVFAGRARLVAAGGGRYRGSDFELLPGSRPADGRLHLLVVEPTGPRGALRVGRLARDGAHVDHDAVHYYRGERFHLHAPAGLPAEVDGTPLGSDPRAIDLSVVPGALRAAVPADA